MKLEFYQLTSIGDRESNQDYMMHIVNDDYALFVVADGLGGHQAGERASSYFCHSLINLAPEFSAKMAENPEQVMADWIDMAVDKMLEAFAGDKVASKAHTTCAILYIQDQILLTAHCGDSRIYRVNQQQMLWRTRDHSVAQGLRDDGELDEQQMGIHPDQNQLTRCINVLKTFKPEINLYPAAQLGDTFVLCSDGFWEFTKPHEFQGLAEAGASKKDLMKQARLAVLRASGHSDNVTVQWVRVKGSAD